MVKFNLDKVIFYLNQEYDFTWLQSLGKVFAVFSQNDCGNISFGVDNSKEKFFIKIAGLKTIESIQTQQEAITTLKSAMQIYTDIKHQNLIKLIRHDSFDNLYIAVFQWAEGDCLFDHWNFETYQKNPKILPPAKRFKQLPLSKRIDSADVVFSFLDTVSKKGYVAVDFYDSSILYDFHSDTTTICDIDLFRKKPTFNNMGEDYYGTKRFKAPEEYRYGDIIDEATNVYTLGALLFNNYFGNYTDKEIQQRYENNAFTPCSLENWEFTKECYHVALKAVSIEKSKRYSTISEFHTAWNAALSAK